MTSYVSQAIDGSTIPQAYLRRIALSPNARAYLVKTDGKYSPVLWHEIHEQVLRIFQNLSKYNLKAGDHISILSATCPKWNTTDLAIQCSGFAAIPIYPSLNAEESAYIIKHAQSKLVFAEDQTQCEKLKEAFKHMGQTLPIVCFSDPCAKVDGLEIVSYDDWMKGALDPGTAEAFKASCLAVKETDTASIVYTSGTTGQPKGVVLSQSNVVHELRAVINAVEMAPDDVTMTFLPFAHILGRVESLASVIIGMTLGFAEDINTVAANIPEVRPTILVSVPRIYEKIYTKMLSNVEASSPTKRKLFYWATDVGRIVARHRSARETIPLLTQLQYQVADKLVFSKVRERMGGRIRLTISGGAPLAPELNEFFHACGIKILEGYGLTETTAAVSANQPDDYCFGSVGKPLDGVEIKIAEDGEILCRGPVIFKEYFHNPEATKESFDGDWFKTGDIGEFTNRGHLKITDRKKEIIVTSGGKNIAPQKLENLIKAIRFVSNAMVYGDKQKYLVALVTLDEVQIVAWAKDQGLSQTSVADIVTQKSTVELIEAELKSVNQHLPSFETIKKFKLLPTDFTVEDGSLTPSLKLKRKVLTNRYESLIKEMY